LDKADDLISDKFGEAKVTCENLLGFFG